MFGDWDGGDEAVGWPPEVDVPVAVVPGYLTARDAVWRPDGEGFDPGFVRGPGGVAETIVVPVDDAGGGTSGSVADHVVLRELAAAVDQQPWLVVPDEGAAYSVVRDERGRLVSTVAGVAPGGDLAGMVERLTALATTGTADASSALAGVGAHELGEVVGACQRLVSWARGTQAAAITELSRRPVMQPLASGASFLSVSAQASTALEVTDVLTVTSGQAQNLVAESVELIEHFPATHAALMAGVIDERRARVVLAELRSHEPDVAHLVEATVLAQAGSLNTTQLRRKIKALLLRLAPVTSEERHSRARADRHVRFNPGEDGMTHIEALLPAEDAAALKAVLDAGQASLKRRDTATGDTTARTADQRRADTLAYLAWTALATGRITPPGNASSTDGAAHSDHAADAASDAEAASDADAAAAGAADAPDTADAADAAGAATEAAADAHASQGTGEGAGAADGAAGVDTADAADRADADRGDMVDANDANDANCAGGDDTADSPPGAGPPPGAGLPAAAPGAEPAPRPGPGASPGSGFPFGTPSDPNDPSDPSDSSDLSDPADAGATGGTGGVGGACRACGSSTGNSGLKLAGAHGRPVTVNVTIPLSTLLGLDEHPGHLDGYGPIPAHIARHLSTAGLWRWVGTDDVTGAVLSHGRTRYKPTQDLIDHVILRDRTCRAPGCDARAEVCELDHSIYWPLGPTAACNLGLFCKKHHLQKHHTRWRIEQPQPGVFRWISPTGRVIETHRTVVGPQPPDGSPPEPAQPEPPPEPPDPADDIPPF